MRSRSCDAAQGLNAEYVFIIIPIAHSPAGENIACTPGLANAWNRVRYAPKLGHRRLLGQRGEGEFAAS